MPVERPVFGKPVPDLDWPGNFGIQVVAMMRDDVAQTGPEVSTRINSGDLLLLLAPPERLEKLGGEIDPPPPGDSRLPEV